MRRPFSARGRPPASAHPPASSPEIPAPLVGESHVVSLGPLYESPFHPQGSAQRHQGPPAMCMVGTCCALSSLPGGERLVRRFRWEDGNAERAAKSCEELRSLWSLWSCELGALQRTLKLADFGLVPPLRAPPLRSAPLRSLNSLPLSFFGSWAKSAARGLRPPPLSALSAEAVYITPNDGPLTRAGMPCLLSAFLLLSSLRFAPFLQARGSRSYMARLLPGSLISEKLPRRTGGARDAGRGRLWLPSRRSECKEKVPAFGVGAADFSPARA